MITMPRRVPLLLFPFAGSIILFTWGQVHRHLLPHPPLPFSFASELSLIIYYNQTTTFFNGSSWALKKRRGHIIPTISCIGNYNCLGKLECGPLASADYRMKW